MSDLRIIHNVSYKSIPLTQGRFAIVDVADYNWLIQWKWGCSSHGYAVHGRNIGTYRVKKTKTIKMHRFIMGNPEGMEVDHINGDKLDNRRCNLRICSHAQNLMNQSPQIGNSSKYKGVHWYKSRGKWRVQIFVNGKNSHLGYFANEAEAAEAYNNTALKYYGEFAKLNIIRNE